MTFCKGPHGCCGGLVGCRSGPCTAGAAPAPASSGLTPASLQDSDGCTAAHKAAGEARKEVLDLILKKHPECAGVSDKRGKLPAVAAER